MSKRWIDAEEHAKAVELYVEHGLEGVVGGQRRT